MIPKHVVELVAHAALVSLAILARSGDGPEAPAAKAPASTPAAEKPTAPPGPIAAASRGKNADSVPESELPASGAERIRFREIYKPIGRRGLELSEKLQALDKKKVTILGYMARQDAGAPGMFILAPIPIVLHEDEYGLCDDLPASAIHVFLPEGERDLPVSFTPGPLLLTGTISVGARAEVDGRNSCVRLTLDPRENGKEAGLASNPPVTKPTPPESEASRPGGQNTKGEKHEKK